MTHILNSVISVLQDALASEFKLHERKGKLYLQTPFYHGDGDGLHIIIKEEGGQYIISDEGHSLMRLSYDLKISQIKNGTRHEIIQSLLAHYNVENRLGEFRIKTRLDELGDALFRMIHLCIRLEDLEFLSRENAKNTFVEDFKREVKLRLDKNLELDWFDHGRDERGDYMVDIMLENESGLIGIFPMFTDHQLMNNTITIHRLRQWGHSINFLGVVQDSKNVSKSSVNKFSDASQNMYYLNEYSKDSIFEEFRALSTTA